MRHIIFTLLVLSMISCFKEEDPINYGLSGEIEMDYTIKGQNYSYLESNINSTATPSYSQDQRSLAGSLKLGELDEFTSLKVSYIETNESSVDNFTIITKEDMQNWISGNISFNRTDKNSIAIGMAQAETSENILISGYVTDGEYDETFDVNVNQLEVKDYTFYNDFTSNGDTIPSYFIEAEFSARLYNLKISNSADVIYNYSDFIDINNAKIKFSIASWWI